MKDIRYAPPGQLAEHTARTNEAQFLMPPSDVVNETIFGCIGRAQHLYTVKLHAFVFMSNHYHMLVTSEDPSQLAAFMCHVNGNVARKMNKLLDRSGRFWQRRFRAIPVDGDEQSQLQRLRYLLAHGVKEGIVNRVRQWRGASSLPWLLDGERIYGTWLSETALYYAKRLKTPKLTGHSTRYEVKLAPLPCFEGMPDTKWRAVVQELVEDIEAKHSTDPDDDRGTGGSDVAQWNGPKSSEDQGPKPSRDMCATRPKAPARSAAPRIHAADRDRRNDWLERLAAIHAAHSLASRHFRWGRYHVAFPDWTFRPHGPLARPDEAPGAAHLRPPPQLPQPPNPGLSFDPSTGHREHAQRPALPR